MKKKIIKVLLQILAMIVLTQLLNFVLYMYDFRSILDVIAGTSFGVSIGMVMIYGHRYIGKEIHKHTSWLQSPVKTILITVASGALFTFVATVVLNFIFFVLILHVPFDHFSRPNWYGIKLAFWLYLISMIITHTILFYMRWKNVAIEQEKQKTESLKLRFEALRNHVNPHFLFNSLSTLTHLIEVDKDKAIEFTNHLSETYRYIVETKEKDLVLLDEEMAFVASYLRLQSIRYGQQVEVSNSIEQSDSFQVIPVSVQMLIENIFKHNVISKESKISIELWIENDFLYVKNNSNPKNDSEDRTPTGLANIRARYKYLSNRECVFGKQGDDFVVAIPLLKKL
jgi:sensor histidine kinase YesM